MNTIELNRPEVKFSLPQSWRPLIWAEYLLMRLFEIYRLSNLWRETISLIIITRDRPAAFPICWPSPVLSIPNYLRTRCSPMVKGRKMIRSHAHSNLIPLEILEVPGERVISSRTGTVTLVSITKLKEHFRNKTGRERITQGNHQGQ